MSRTTLLFMAFCLGSMILIGCGSDSEPSTKPSTGTASQADSEQEQSEATEQATAAASREPSTNAEADATDQSAATQELSESDRLLQIARTHLSRGEFGRAIEAASQAIGLDASNSDAYLQRAELYGALGENANAMADFSTAIRLTPNNPQLYNSRGYFLMSRNKLDAAWKDFSQAIERNPKISEAYNNRALVHLARKEFEQALGDLSLAIKQDAKYIDALNNRGYVLSELGRYEDALEDFARVLEMQPEYGNTLNNRGLAHFKAEQFDAALADFSTAIELEPFNRKYVTHRREVLLKLERHVDAEQDAERIAWLEGLRKLTIQITQAPMSADVYLARGSYLFKEGEQEEALDDMNRAVALGPGRTECLIRRAEIWSAMDLYRNAVNDCTAALEIADAPEAHSIRGDAWLELGETRKAIDDYVAAKRIDVRVAEAYLRHAEELREAGEEAASDQAVEQARRLDPTIEIQ